MRLNVFRLWGLIIIAISIIVGMVVLNINSGRISESILIFAFGVLFGLAGCFFGHSQITKQMMAESALFSYLAYWIIAGGALVAGYLLLVYTPVIDWLGVEFESISAGWNYFWGFVLGGLVIDAVVLINAIKRKKRLESMKQSKSETVDK